MLHIKALHYSGCLNYNLVNPASRDIGHDLNKGNVLISKNRPGPKKSIVPSEIYSKFAKPSIQIAGPKNIQHYEANYSKKAIKVSKNRPIIQR